MPDEDGKVTTQEAEAALRQLAFSEDYEGAPAEKPKEQPAEQQQADAGTETAVAAQEDEQQMETTEAPEVAEDDLASLQQRREELEARLQEQEQSFKERLHALNERSSTNERILRDRYLKKSTGVDKALQILKRARTEDGVSEADVDAVIREIEASMNPNSASYVPPAQAPAANEDQALVLNAFLNEQQMTANEANEFGRWIATDAAAVMSPTEQAIANESLDGFLRLAHVRFRESQQAKQTETARSDTVEAVKSVQRTQRAAARAASSPSRAPRASRAETEQQINTEDLKPSDISALLRQSVEDYR